jgi:glycerol-3-phosphate dehydrogenase (NAD(P)+)
VYGNGEEEHGFQGFACSCPYPRRQPIVYWLTRAVLQPFAHLFWRLSRIGRERIPVEGPVLVVCNHRSIIDPFIIGLCTRRPIYYVAKEEIFRNRLLGWFVSSLGAFPVRRGAADADMIETPRRSWSAETRC